MLQRFLIWVRFVYSENADCIGLVIFCLLIPPLLISICCFVSWKSSSKDKVQVKDIDGCKGCSYILFDQNTLEFSLFFPNHASQDKGNFIYYFSSLHFPAILTILSNLLDIASDIGFAKTSFDIFPCVGMISAACTCTGGLAFFLCWYSDFLNWKHGFAKPLRDEEKQRKIQRLRWS